MKAEVRRPARNDIVKLRVTGLTQGHIFTGNCVPLRPFSGRFLFPMDVFAHNLLLTDTKKKGNETMKKKHIIALVLALILAAGMLFAYSAFGEKPTEGTKEIIIEVVDDKETSTVYEVKTDAEYLISAMEDAEGLTFNGSEGQYGFTVSEVNGVTADFNVDSSYWAFYVNGEYCNYGISEQPVNDGDAFRIVYSTY